MSLCTLFTPFSQKYVLREGYLHGKTDGALRLVIDCDLNWHWGVKDDRLFVEIARDFEKLTAAPFQLYSVDSECIVENQPTWDMSECPDGSHHKHEGRTGADCTNPCQEWKMEHLAYYASAHENTANRYGIHLTKRGIAKVAHQVHQLCPDQPIEIIQLASVYKLFAHEMCHAWIEDICSLMDFSSGEKASNGDRRYAITNRRYNGYIFMEEAICNTAAYGWLYSFLHCTPNKPTIPTFDPEIILNAFGRWMRNQPKGYCDFQAISDVPHQSDVFVRNVWKLLANIYGVDDGDAASAAIGTFFGGDLTPDGKSFNSRNDSIWDCLWYARHLPVHIEEG